MKTLDSFDFRNKVAFVRSDLNSPFDDHKKRISGDERIMAATPTIKKLLKSGARVVVMAHQGRRGEKDFVHLDDHAKLLSKCLKKKVLFVRDVAGPKAKSAINDLEPGQVLLLDNVRFLADETDEKKALEGNSTLVKELVSLCDIFVNDAFSVSHRAQASVIGFAKRVPSCFGLLMQEEIASADKAVSAKGRNVYVLGGAKSDDCIAIMDHILNTNPREMEFALLCGVTANIFMKAAGMRIGKKSEEFLRKKGLIKQVGTARRLLRRYHRKILLPIDVAIEQNGKRKEVAAKNVPKDAQILDIGKKTIAAYEKILRHATTVVLKGPAGLFEDKRFSKGTKELFDCIAGSKAYSIVGGGDTTQAIDRMSVSRKKFSHVSLGGGALITYLSGKPMPGIDAVNAGAERKPMKYIQIVLDGVGDIGRTPLMVAKKPAIDSLARRGTVGLYHIKFGDHVNSDVGYLALLSYHNKKLYPGRGYLEALGINLKPGNNDVCIRGNFATLDRKGILIDRRAGRDEYGLNKLCRKLDGIVVDGVRFSVKRSESHRVVIVMRGKGLDMSIKPNDPEETGVKLKPILPVTDKAKFTATAINHFLDRANVLLAKDAINKKRKFPANTLLIRNTGMMKKAETFKKRFGLNACCIAGVPIAKGVARFLGMDVINIKGVTGTPKTDLKAQFKALEKNMRKYDFIFFHINSTDIFSHDAQYEEKVKCVEHIDSYISRLTGKTDLQSTRIVITCDHRTASSPGYKHYRHLKLPVPFLIAGAGIMPMNMRFDEKSCAKGMNLDENRFVQTVIG